MTTNQVERQLKRFSRQLRILGQMYLEGKITYHEFETKKNEVRREFGLI